MAVGKGWRRIDGTLERVFANRAQVPVFSRRGCGAGSNSPNLAPGFCATWSVGHGGDEASRAPPDGRPFGGGHAPPVCTE